MEVKNLQSLDPLVGGLPRLESGLGSVSASVHPNRRLIWTACFTAGLLLYGLTMAPGLLWGDSGECQLHVLHTNWIVPDEIARAHVMYYALARTLHGWLSDDAAWSANLVSVMAGAVTVANVAWLLSTLCRTATAWLCGTLLWMVSHSFWQLSTSAEVMTLMTALLTAELLFLFRWFESKRGVCLILAALLNGLGVSNHNMAMLMWPVYGVTAFRFRRPWFANAGRHIPPVLVFLLIGLAPVLILCVTDFAIRKDLLGTLQSFLVGHYGPEVLNLKNTGNLILRSAAIAVMNFPTPLAMLALVGVFHLGKKVPPVRHPLPVGDRTGGIPLPADGLSSYRAEKSAAVAWILFGACLVFTAFGCRYNVPDQNTFLVPAFLFWTIFMAMGIDRVMLRYRLGRRTAFLMVALSVLGPVVYAAGPPVLRRLNWSIPQLPQRVVPYRDRFDWFLQPWRFGYDGAERFARETLNVMPPDAILVTDGTLCTPLNYVQDAYEIRRDVRLDHTRARQDWFKVPLSDEVRHQKLAEGKVFSTSNDPVYLPLWLKGPQWSFEPYHTVFRVGALNGEAAH